MFNFYITDLIMNKKAYSPEEKTQGHRPKNEPVIHIDQIHTQSNTKNYNICYQVIPKPLPFIVRF